MKDTKWHRVSLRFFGDELDVDAIEFMIGLAPTYHGRRGAHIDGNPRYAKHPTNYWSCSFTQDEETAIPFDEQIGDLLDVLEPQEHNLKELLQIPGIEGELFLGFSSDGQGGGQFSRLLLERISKLGLGLNLDLYPPTMVSEPSAQEALYSSGSIFRPLPMAASLIEFIRTGALGSIELGMNRDQVEAILGPPPKWLTEPEGWIKAFIWEYGDISLSFEGETLQIITMNDFEIPASGNSIIMDGSLLTNCLTLAPLRQQLDEAGIVYAIENHPRSDSYIYLVAEGGARLMFSTDYEDDPLLVSISHRLKTI